MSAGSLLYMTDRGRLLAIEPRVMSVKSVNVGTWEIEGRHRKESADRYGEHDSGRGVGEASP